MPPGAIAGCVQADEGRCNSASGGMADSNHVSLAGEQPAGTRPVLSKAGELADRVCIFQTLVSQVNKFGIRLCIFAAAHVATSQRRLLPPDSMLVLCCCRQAELDRAGRAAGWLSMPCRICHVRAQRLESSKLVMRSAATTWTGH